jgi:dienelactone hydrolase
MQFQSKACCSRPPVVLAGGYNYTPTGTYTTYSGLKTYETGPKTSTRGILFIYDVFGLYIQTLRGADILSTGFPSPLPLDNSGTYRVFMPDFFSSEPAELSNYPPKTPKQFSYISQFMAGPADPSKTLPLIPGIMKELQEKNPEIESWAVLGFCWGGKIAALSSQEGTLFKASAQAHPSLLDTEDAKKIVIPHVVLPSNDEVPEVMEEWVKELMKSSPKSYNETFTDQVHGWMTSRADFENQHNFEEYLRGYRIVRAFFDEHM